MTTTNTYKALIFDLGRVVFETSFDLSFWSWGKSIGVDREEVRRRFKFDDAYDIFSCGNLTGEEYAQHVSSLLKSPLSYDDFERGWNSIYLDEFPGIARTLAALKKSYRIVALTNTNSVHAKVWPAKYAATLQHFEKIFSSQEMRTCKPERRAYEMVLEYVQLPAHETIFLDDAAENVVGAEVVGMKGILVTSTSQMREELRKANINLS
jgi:glucose-1-phosphatase